MEILVARFATAFSENDAFTRRFTGVVGAALYIVKGHPTFWLCRMKVDLHVWGMIYVVCLSGFLVSFSLNARMVIGWRRDVPVLSWL